MTDPTTLSDADLKSALEAVTAALPTLQAAAAGAKAALSRAHEDHHAMKAEADFRAVLRDLRKPTSVEQLQKLRTLAGAPSVHMSRKPEWLIARGLARHNGSISYEKRFQITDLGRRALAAIDGAP